MRKAARRKFPTRRFFLNLIHAKGIDFSRASFYNPFKKECYKSILFPTWHTTPYRVLSPSET